MPFESLRWVNAYLISGSETTLVDCGIHDPGSNGEETMAALHEGLSACGVAPEAIQRLVVTHPHVDHYGMASHLVGSLGVELWMHEAAPAELAAYEHPDQRNARLRRLLGPEADGWGEKGPFEDWGPYLSGIVHPSHHVGEGQFFSVGARTWRVVHTPGHSRSHMCLWSEDDGLLISGDHLLGSITPHVDAGDAGEDPLGDYLDSLVRVEKLAPRLVLPGHGRPFEDGAERARATLRHHERRLGAILQVLRPRPASLSEVAEQIFGSPLLDLDRRLALSEALAHLDHLERSGEVFRIEADDARVLFAKTKRVRAEIEP